MKTEPHAPTSRAFLLGIVLILLGLALGVLTIATLIGPIIGLVLVALGLFVLWQSAKEDPPDTFSS